MLCLVGVLLDRHFLPHNVPMYRCTVSESLGSPEGTENGKSFVHSANRVCPRTDPRGIPIGTGCIFDLRGETLNYKPVAKDAYIADCKHKLQR